MASNFLRLLVLLLGFSHLLSLNAVPVTRTRSLLHEYHGHVISDATTQLVKKEDKSLEGKTINGRMDLVLNDYPGSGANNRHTPRRGCVDC